MATYTDLNPVVTDKTDCLLADVDAINASLYNLFLTEKGTDYFRPSRGIGFKTWIYSIINDQVAKSREAEVLQQISTWEPRIIVDSCDLTYSSNVLTVIVSYHMRSPNSNLQKNNQFYISARK